ncbi:hypothetical protein HY11_14260 [Hyphomonas pacifica]|nr:hypothetical protein HY11_14260 [Hyphomonas pacifica]
MLAFAALAILATIAAGFQAYYTVAHDGPSHEAMTTHRNWAVPSGAAIVLLAVWRWRRRQTPATAIFKSLLTVAAISLSVTAWWGGHIVYNYGLGVQSLPTVTGDGHDHDHGDAGRGVAMSETDDPAEHGHDLSNGRHDEDAASAGTHDNSDGHHAEDAPENRIQESADGSPSGIVTQFGLAMRAGDIERLRTLVAPDVIIAEGGGTERSFDEYAGQHMSADIAFMGAVDSTLKRRDVIDGSGLSTVISESQIHGKYNNKTVHAKMTETMVLRETKDGWRIAHIHWSSAPITGEHEH